MKKLKKILLLCLFLMFLLVLLIVVKCNNDLKKDFKEEKKIILFSDSEFEKLVNEINDLNDFVLLFFSVNFG